MKNKTIYTERFHYVSFKSKDGIASNDLYIGTTPAESLANAKSANIRCKGFKAGKTAYNTLGEKL